MKTTNFEEALRKAIERARRRAIDGCEVILSVLGESFYVFALPVRKGPETTHDEEGFDQPWKADFLDWFRKGRTVKEAAELSGITPRHAHRSYHRDPVFARAWDEAQALKRENARRRRNVPR